MTGVPLIQVSLGEGWQVNASGLECGQSPLGFSQVFCGAKNNEVGISAKFSCAVDDAGLSAYEKAFYPGFLEGKKDFEDRVLGQDFLLKPGIISTVYQTI